MKIIIFVLFVMTCTNLLAQNKTDFSVPEELNYWYPVNDSVMGGSSQSNFRVVDNVAYFEGVLSLKNNGGFASVRRIGPLVFESGNTPILLEINGDGRRYQLRLRTNKAFDGVAYVATFLSSGDKWQTLTFKEQDFFAQFRGRLVNRAPALSFSDVQQMGLMLADKQPGSFRLAIKSIGQ
ncbi:MAG: NADH dehydrogenase [ubiquinone] 1 alpha subcomplex assembly factor 1 [Flavobacteriales bacterium]|jgi:monofunctional biosynthetic peptidoglycan transglycosylase